MIVKKRLVESPKEEEIYLVGTFWIVAKSVRDILKNNFKIIGEKHYVDYNGNPIDKNYNRSHNTHKYIWKNDSKYREEAEKFTGLDAGDDYTYFPRGRVCLFENNYYIFLPNELFNNPHVINALSSFYELNNKIKEINI